MIECMVSGFAMHNCRTSITSVNWGHENNAAFMRPSSYMPVQCAEPHHACLLMKHQARCRGAAWERLQDILQCMLWRTLKAATAACSEQTLRGTYAATSTCCPCVAVMTSPCMAQHGVTDTNRV